MEIKWAEKKYIFKILQDNIFTKLTRQEHTILASIMCVQSIKVHKKFTRFLEFSSQVQYISLRMIRVPDYVRSSVTTRFWLLRTYKRLPDKSLYINAIIHTLLVRIILRISLPVLAFFFISFHVATEVGAVAPFHQWNLACAVRLVAFLPSPYFTSFQPPLAASK